MPHGRDICSCKHAGDRDRPELPRAEQVGRHRLNRERFTVKRMRVTWKSRCKATVCAVKEEALAKYFASQADRNIRRRERQVEARRISAALGQNSF